MFSHVMVGTNDLQRSKKFYDATLGALGVGPARLEEHRIFYMSPGGSFSVTQPINGQPATAPNGGTNAWACTSLDQPSRPRVNSLLLSPPGEMVNAADLKSAAFGHTGSSPVAGKRR